MPNRLAAEKSPYLRQHADNPVDWLPWGEEAFARAQAGQKPIFLSIGYSTCHWCHVMAHESFEDAGVAAILNRDFVPVKLDREERPDLDRVYMTYVQQTTGHGGWPMSVWLTPGLKPFYGGTYFPREDRAGRPGFITLLNTITRHWQEQRTRIEAGAEEVVQALRRYAAEGAPRAETDAEAAPVPLHEAAAEAFERGFQYFHEAYDARWGGFGGAPKFPRASAISFLLRTAALQGSATDLGQEAIKLAAHTLQRMAEGGLHDHLGGGFHRYSVDEQWHVPHFEKMLYDQAQIALNYLEAQAATGIGAYAWVARGIFDYVARDLTSPAGGFYSAEDADSPLDAAKGSKEQGAGGKAAHAEGAFYVWTQKEIETVLNGLPVGGVPSPRGNDASPGEGTRPTTDAEFFCAHFDVKPAGNVAHDPAGEFSGRNVLRQLHSLTRTAQACKLELPAAEAKLVACLERLRQARTRRPRPHLDDKIITAWNGLMISALAKGHQVLECRSLLAGDSAEPSPASRLLPTATRAAEFLQRELHDEATGTLYRSWREGRGDIAGFAEDYAYLIQGLLDLYEAGGEIRWLQWAEKLQARMDGTFWDAAHGGYFNSRADDPAVIVRLKEDYDGAEPSPNSVAAMNLVRLDWMLGGVDTRPAGPGYRERALQTIGALRGQWSRAPHALPQMLCALEWALAEPRSVVLAGDPAAADFRALAAVLAEQPGPRRVVLAAAGGAGQQWLASRRPDLAGMKPVDGRATAYVCENFACRAPVNTPAALRALLQPWAPPTQA